MTSSEPAENDGGCPICGPPIELDGGRTIHLRHSTVEDWQALREFYGRLDRPDLHRRFFTGGVPPPTFFQHWASIGDGGGLGLLVELDEGTGADDDRRLIGEAGYALLASGDGELGIAVEAGHRGWLGPWLLALLLDHAHDRGVPNLQAVVLVDNPAMMRLAERRGFVVLDHLDWGTVRITMSTTGRVPTWPGTHERPRVLIESRRTRSSSEETLRRIGFDVAVCNGPCRSHGSCPVLEGERCPLVEGADAVVVDLPPDDPLTTELIDAERLIHPGVRLIAGYEYTDLGMRHRTPADLADAVTETVAEATKSEDREDRDGRDGQPGAETELADDEPDAGSEPADD
jgi:RimJ/RimL family protein N-acetyltransferase